MQHFKLILCCECASRPLLHKSASCMPPVVTFILFASRTVIVEAATLAFSIADLLNSHELTSIIVQAKINSAKSTCAHHFPNLPIDFLPNRKPLHPAGGHSTIAIWPACCYEVCTIKFLQICRFTQTYFRSMRSIIRKQPTANAVPMTTVYTVTCSCMQQYVAKSCCKCSLFLNLQQMTRRARHMQQCS